METRCSKLQNGKNSNKQQPTIVRTYCFFLCLSDRISFLFSDELHDHEDDSVKTYYPLGLLYVAMLRCFSYIKDCTPAFRARLRATTALWWLMCREWADFSTPKYVTRKKQEHWLK